MARSGQVILLCKVGITEEAIRRLRDILSTDRDDAETPQILAVADERAACDLAKTNRLFQQLTEQPIANCPNCLPL